MSQSYKDLGALYEIFAGTAKTFYTDFIDPATGQAQDQNDATLFSTVKAIIVKPSGDIIKIITGSYSNRPTGKVQWIVTADVSNNNNAGNWLVEVQLFNSSGDKVDQQVANFNIIESY